MLESLGPSLRYVRPECEDEAMEIEIGRGKKARQAYGFDDIDLSWKLGPYQFELPLMASAMDGVVSPRTAGIVGNLMR